MAKGERYRQPVALAAYRSGRSSASIGSARRRGRAWSAALRLITISKAVGCSSRITPGLVPKDVGDGSNSQVIGCSEQDNVLSYGYSHIVATHRHSLPAEVSVGASATFSIDEDRYEPSQTRQ
jgi:hypothetical protein